MKIFSLKSTRIILYTILTGSITQFITYVEQYEGLKRLIIKFYTIDENIGSKIVKEKDIF